MDRFVLPRIPDHFLWLTSPEAKPFLQLAAAELTSEPTSLVRLTTKLRKSLDAEQAHLVLEQIDLRRRAREKFASAETMFFTSKSLMQASDEIIAAYKARRFPAGEQFADLCCGIGGDLLALAGQGRCTGVDLDEILVHLAQRNCEATGGEGGAIVADAATFSVEDYAAWHIDPDRRPSGRRTTKTELHQPPLEALKHLLAKNPKAAMKLAPATEIPEQWRQTAEREWLESRGECRQQVAWLGGFARHPGEKLATIVDAAGGPRTVQGREGPVPTVERVGRYVYEPAAAVLAARLSQVLCQEHKLAAVSSQAMYLTGNMLIDDPALTGFEVLEILPLDDRQLKAWLRQRGIGRLEVKKRGCDVEPEKLRKKLSGEGTKAATLLVCPQAGKIQAIMAQRLSRMGA